MPDGASDGLAGHDDDPPTAARERRRAFERTLSRRKRSQIMITVVSVHSCRYARRLGHERLERGLHAAWEDDHRAPRIGGQAA